MHGAGPTPGKNSIQIINISATSSIAFKEIPLDVLPDENLDTNGHGNDATPDNEARYARSPFSTFPRKRGQGQTNRYASFTLTGMEKCLPDNETSHVCLSADRYGSSLRAFTLV